MCERKLDVYVLCLMERCRELFFGCQKGIPCNLWYDSSHLTPVDSHRLLSSSMQLILALVLHVARCPLPFPPRR